jgi:PAS domain S-box-containing protein
MKLLRHAPLQRKLTLVTMLSSGVALLFAAFAILAYDHAAQRQALVRDLTLTADMVGYNCASALSFSEPYSAEHTLRGLEIHPHIVTARVFGPDGSTFAVYSRHRTLVPTALPAPPIKHGTVHFGAGYVDLVRSIDLEGDHLGFIHLRSSLAELHARVRNFTLLALGVILLAAGAALVLSRRLQRIVSDPVSHLAGVARRVTLERNYAVRAVKTGEDELGQLIDGFNAMLGEVQARDAELLAAQSQLERRVEERTAELRNEMAERRLVAAERDRFFTLSVDLMAIVGFDGTLRRGNPACAEALGHAPDSLAGLGFWDWFHPDDRVRARTHFERLREGTTLRDLEVRCLRPDGSVRWIAWSAVLVPGGTTFFACGRDITDRKQTAAALEQAHRELLETSRLAGMAEVATGVLHNVGNVLNSVNVSATLAADRVRRSRAGGVGQLATLLRENSADLPGFFARDARAARIPAYLETLAEHLAAEQRAILEELAGLQKNIEHIKDIVSMQQNYAKVSGIAETVDVVELVEDALNINASALERHRIEIVRDYQARPAAVVQRHKVLQILVNLVRNAKHACTETPQPTRCITVRVTEHDERVAIVVADNGVGIAPANLTKIFAHGFTTRKNGHGFGLHSGALAAVELGGSLRAASDGPGRGATFTLEFPLLAGTPA